MSDRPDPLLPPYEILYKPIIINALLEDLGRAGDVTTDALVPPESQATALLLARAQGRLAGVDIALTAFRCLDPRIEIEVQSRDGADVRPGDQLALLHGGARPLLSAERTALNFLGRLSGVATATHSIVSAVAPWPARVVCTRKTTPGLRALEKYAVRAGGGSNHRFGLDDAVLIKDNHRIVAGGVKEAVRRVRQHIGHMVKIEVEVDTLTELEEALVAEVDAVLLDNMPLEMLTEGVRMARGKAITEASGNITPASAPGIAATGVDLISIGWITHSAPALDVALDFTLSL